MTSFSLSGIVHKIMDTNERSATFKVREFVLEVADGQYSQLISMQCTQDYCDQLDNFTPGELVAVDFNIRGREWNSKYLTNLQAWRIKPQTDAPTVAPPKAVKVLDRAAPVIVENLTEVEQTDDLPF